MRQVLRIAWLFAVAAVLPGCGTNSNEARYGRLLWRLVSGQQVEVSRDQAGAIPFATIGITIGRADEGLMVLGLVEGGRQEWYARTQMIAMNNGRVLQTDGFPFNLSRLEVRAAGGATLQGGPPPLETDYSIVVDFQDLRLVGASARCRSSETGQESIEILGTPLITQHVMERCKVDVIDWSFENEFWVDPDSGFVWQSRQYIHPKLARLTLRVLRPPA